MSDEPRNPALPQALGMREAMEEIANRAANFSDPDAAEWMESIYRIACAALAAPDLKITQAEIMAIGDTVTRLREMGHSECSQLESSQVVRPDAVNVPTAGSNPASPAKLIAEVEDLLGVIEATRENRGILRVSGMRGDSLDVGVIGIDHFNRLMRSVVGALSYSSEETAVAWLVPSDETGFCRIWWRDKERADAWIAKHPTCTLLPLYAAPVASDATSQAIQDAYDRLKAGIAALKASNTRVPIELHKAAHALSYAMLDDGASPGDSK